MIAGTLLLSIASLLLLLDIYSLSKTVSSVRSFRNRSSAFILSVFCILVAFIIYIGLFLSNDFSLRDVYSYSSDDLPIMYKLYASWAGVGGSLLLWSVMLGSIYLVYRTLNRRTVEQHELRSYMHLDIYLIFIVTATTLADPFGRLGFEVSSGLGLNPLLQSPWMAVHPPVIFLGYALPFFAVALSLVNLSTGKDSHEDSIRFFMRSSWLVLTLGIALGGVWAYEVLGWGGYWSWDPVETASLLPWLMLTAYFHTAPMAGRGRSLVREFSILTVALLVLFATIITRSGVLESVHTFGVSSTAIPFILFFLYLAGYFLYLRGKVGRPVFRLSGVGRSKTSVSLTVGYVALVYITVVCLLGLSLPSVHSIQFATAYSVGKEFYNVWLFPPTILFVATLICCNTPNRVGLRSCTIPVAVAFLGGFLAAVLGVPTPNRLANFGVPFLLVALAVIVYSLLGGIVKQRGIRSLPSLGRSLIHASLILILIGVLLSSSMEVSDQKSLRVGEVYSGLGVTLKLTNLRFDGPSGYVYTRNGSLPEHSSLVVDVVASSCGSNYSGQLWTDLYTVYGLTSRPLIFRSVLNDIYITVGFTDSLYQALLTRLASVEHSQLSELTIHVKVIPYVNLIWFGVALFTAGMAVSMAADRKSQGGKD